jgi:hypothetical protein
MPIPETYEKTCENTFGYEAEDMLERLGHEDEACRGESASVAGHTTRVLSCHV